MKVAVIGIGKLGKRHLEKWLQIKEVEIVGIIARNEIKRNEVSEKYETIGFKSVEALLREVEVDVFDICTPTDTHLSFIKQAAKAKKHVICEKPLALTYKETQEAVEICAQNNVQLFVGQTLQFFPAYAYTKKEVENGRIGKPLVVHMARGVPYPANARDWYVDENKSGGLLLDLGVHEFEWIVSTFGKVKTATITDIKYLEKKKTIIYGVVTLRLANEILVHVELSWDEPSFRASFKIVGEEATMKYDHKASAPTILDTKRNSTIEIPVDHLSQQDPYEAQLGHFINCIRGIETPNLSISHAADAVLIAQAARESAVTGTHVMVSGGKE